MHISLTTSPLTMCKSELLTELNYSFCCSCWLFKGFWTLRPRTICHTDYFRPKDCSSHELFDPRTVRSTDCSSNGLFIPWTVVRPTNRSSNRLFVLRTVLPTDCSSRGLFIQLKLPTNNE